MSANTRSKAETDDAAEEMRRLAARIAELQGGQCAVVVIAVCGEEYEDVHPQLILEDALKVDRHGWPAGFDVNLLNSAD